MDKRLELFYKLKKEAIIRIDYALDSVGGHSRSMKNIPDKTRDSINRLILKMNARDDKEAVRELMLHKRDIKPLIKKINEVYEELDLTEELKPEMDLVLNKWRIL